MDRGTGILERLFGRDRAVIGVVHLLPLPGSPRWGGDMGAVVDRAVADARALRRGGVDGAIVENYGDAPFVPGAVEPACVAALAAAVRECARAVPLPLGVNVLRNDPVAALAVALAGGARFVRTNVHTGTMLTDQGTLHGLAHATLRERARLGAAEVAVFADVLVKHAASAGPRDPRRAGRDAVERGHADVLLVTGEATGRRADLREVATVRDAVPETPLLVASGAVVRDLRLLAALCDGVIVGTALKVDGRTANPVDPGRVREFVRAFRKGFR